MWVLLIVAVWALISFGMGMYSRRRGMSFFQIFVISLFLTPIAGVIAFAFDARRRERLDAQRRGRTVHAKADPTWACLKCGTLNGGSFCSNCGAHRP